MGRIKASVALFEAIRRAYEFGVGTIQGVARQFGVHRRLVREALGNAVPAERKRPQRERPAIGPLVAFIDEILLADCTAPRKQRHTAHRIYTRITGAAGVPDRTSSSTATRGSVEVTGICNNTFATFASVTHPYGSSLFRRIGH